MTTASANRLAHGPDPSAFLLPEPRKGCRYLDDLQILVQLVYSAIELWGFLLLPSLKFNYSCAKGKTKYF